MLHTGERVTDACGRTGAVMGEVRYKNAWYKIVLLDGADDPVEIHLCYLGKIDV